VRDNDVHALAAEGKEIQLVNIAFPRRHWTQMLGRYFADLSDPMRLPVEQRTRAMKAEDHQHLRSACTRMIQADRTRAHLDHFLIEVIWMWSQLRATPADESPMPEWLTTALRDMANPEHLQGGTRALADLAGRSPDHVARAAKRWLGKSPTELVNEARMEHAARLLAGTDREILDIADDCGLPNLAHFYKLFAARYGCTPRRYRLQQFKIVGHPLAV
jgi:AraC family cel operon transcriptional repressor